MKNEKRFNKSVLLIGVLIITFCFIFTPNHLDKKNIGYDEFGEKDFCVNKCKSYGLEKVRYDSKSALDLYCVCKDPNTNQRYYSSVFETD